MLILQSFGPAFEQPDASPFCTKVMCLLNMGEIRWSCKPGADSRKAPMKKLPVLIDGEQTIADSEAIRLHLQQHHGADFDHRLSDEQKALARAISRMTEEHLYFCLLYDRWKIETNWPQLKEAFFSSLPPVVRSVVPPLVRRSVVAALDGQGLGRFTYDQMLGRAELDFSSLESLIGTGPFIFGEKATSVDASAGSFLAAISASPASTPLRERVRSSPVLMNYIAVVKAEIFPAE